MRAVQFNSIWKIKWDRSNLRPIQNSYSARGTCLRSIAAWILKSCSCTSLPVSVKPAARYLAAGQQKRKGEKRQFFPCALSLLWIHIIRSSFFKILPLTIFKCIRSLSLVQSNHFGLISCTILALQSDNYVRNWLVELILSLIAKLGCKNLPIYVDTVPVLGRASRFEKLQFTPFHIFLSNLFPTFFIVLALIQFIGSAILPKWEKTT